jgi:hypothetical protein
LTPVAICFQRGDRVVRHFGHRVDVLSNTTSQPRKASIAAGQEIFHLHMHLIPRWTGDSPLTSWGHDVVEGKRVAETH